MKANPLMPPRTPKASLIVWRGYRMTLDKKDELFNQAVLLANSEISSSNQIGQVNLILENCIISILKSYFYGVQE